MSALRVLNPAILTEFCKLRASPLGMGRNMSCNRQVNRIKRDLFGPANPVETQQIFTEELEKHQETATKKWGFDFRTGSPLTANSQYVWERVSFQESSYAPEVYTLTRAAHVRPTPTDPSAADLLMDERAEREYFIVNTSASTDTDSCGDDSQDELMPGVFKVPAVGVSCRSSSSSGPLLTSLHNRSSSKSPLRKRQPKITEYMKERKRLAQTPKKVSPAKRMRTNSSGSGSPSHHSHSAHAYSISAHFTLQRSLQRNDP